MLLQPAAIVSGFVLVAIPVIILVVVWAAVSAFRLYFPERPLPLLPDDVLIREKARLNGEAVAVSALDIREDLRRKKHEALVTYQYAGTATAHVPEPWIADLHRRRN
jgi:hypothetical protein